MELNYVSNFKHHLSEVSVIKLSHDGQFVASGDNSKNIQIWSTATKEIKIDRFVYHNSKVFDIDWSSDDTMLISGSLDRSVILWSIPEKSKVKIFEDVDNEVVNTVIFSNNAREFLCGGNKCSLLKMTF